MSFPFILNTLNSKECMKGREWRGEGEKKRKGGVSRKKHRRRTDTVAGPYTSNILYTHMCPSIVHMQSCEPTISVSEHLWGNVSSLGD